MSDATTEAMFLEISAGDRRPGVHQVTVTDLDQAYGNFDFGNQAIPRPSVTSTLINAGQQSRSQITSLEVQFNELVDHQKLAQAFCITNQDSLIEVGEISVEASNLNGRTTAVLTFDGSSTISRMGQGAQGNSLADGNYQLTVVAENVIGASSGLAMESDFVFGGNDSEDQRRDDFFRLYGDMNGDGRVSLTDFGTFRGVFGDDDDPHGFDADGDGLIGLSDFGRFRSNFGSERQ